MEPYVPYRAYLIRIWPTRRDGVAGYRATAEEVSTGECRNFPDLESLFAFLRAQGSDPVRQGVEETSDGCDDEFSGSNETADE